MTLRAPSSTARSAVLLPVEQAWGTRHGIHAAPPVASRSEQRRGAHVAQALSSPVTHPDAAVRDLERQKRRIARSQVREVEKIPNWWESEHAHNVCTIQQADQLTEHLEAARCPTSRPVLMSFFLPECPGCKRMFPKFMQIARENPQFDFVKVNTADLQAECNALGVNSLPYFAIWVSGDLFKAGSCNLSTIGDLRRSIAKATELLPPRPARTLFRNPSITEVPPLSPTAAGAAGAAGGARDARATAAPPPAAAATASASAPAGTFRQKTERVHAPSRGRDGGPAGAVGGSGSRLPSIDDLVSHRCPADSPADTGAAPSDPAATNEDDPSSQRPTASE